MKEWMKVSYNWLKDPKMQQLIKNHGLKGLGAYLILRLEMECVDDGGSQYRSLISRTNAYSGRRIFDAILSEPGLFYQDTDGLFRACVRVNVRSQPLAEVHMGDILCNREEKNRKDISYSPLQQQEESIPPEFLKFKDYDWFPLVYPFVRSDKDPGWWEMLSQKASGWSQLLFQHRQEAFLFYMEHLVIFGYEHKLHSEQDVIFHVANVILHSKTGEGLMKYLIKLEKDE